MLCSSADMGSIRGCLAWKRVEFQQPLRESLCAFCRGKARNALQSGQTGPSGVGIASRGFRHNKLRGDEIKPLGCIAPPFPRDSLLCRDDEIARLSRC